MFKFQSLWLPISYSGPRGAGSSHHHTEKKERKKLKSQCVFEMFWCMCVSLPLYLSASLSSATVLCFSLDAAASFFTFRFSLTHILLKRHEERTVSTHSFS